MKFKFCVLSEDSLLNLLLLCCVNEATLQCAQSCLNSGCKLLKDSNLYGYFVTALCQVCLFVNYSYFGAICNHQCFSLSIFVQNQSSTHPLILIFFKLTSVNLVWIIPNSVYPRWNFEEEEIHWPTHHTISI